jgi:hypothetical protein
MPDWRAEGEGESAESKVENFREDPVTYRWTNPTVPRRRQTKGMDWEAVLAYASGS